MKTTTWKDLKIKSKKEQKILMSDTRKRDGSIMILKCIEKGKGEDGFVIRSIGQKDHFVAGKQILKMAEFVKSVEGK